MTFANPEFISRSSVSYCALGFRALTRSMPVGVKVGHTVRFEFGAAGAAGAAGGDADAEPAGDTRVMGKVVAIFRAHGVIWLRVREWVMCEMTEQRADALGGCRDVAPAVAIAGTLLVPLVAAIDFQVVQHLCKFGADEGDASLCFRVITLLVGGDRRQRRDVRHSATNTEWLWNRFASEAGKD